MDKKSITGTKEGYLQWIILLLIILIVIAIRLAINFKSELMPGVNGIYYPLQVRSILENGKLAFPDEICCQYF